MKWLFLILLLWMALLVNAQTIVCYGTSLTRVGKYPETLQQQLPNAKVINSGKGGMNSDWGVKNLEDKVIKLNPDIVLMEFSINDACLVNVYWSVLTSLEDSKSNWIKMIDEVRIKLPKCKIYLMTMNLPADTILSGRNPFTNRPFIKTYNQLVEDIAKFRHTGFINITDEWNKIDKETYLNKYSPNDGLHINELGSKEIIIPKILSSLTK